MSELFTWDTAKFSVKVPEMDREHQQIILLMNKLYGLYKSEAPASGKLGDDLFVFLKMWLSAHICGIDMKYGVHPH